MTKSKLVLAASIGALVSIAGFLAVASVLRPRSDQRSWRIFPDMARSYAYASQTPNPFLPNHQTQQPPVTETIARGEMPLRYDSSVKDFVRAGQELVSPFDLEHPPDIERAARVFGTYCQVCHGASGAGDGLVPQHGFPAPPSLLFGKALNMKDGHIFHIVTHGFRKMPSYAAQISVEDRWLAIAYVRRLQGRLP